jgi:hypothetical protein
MKEKFILTFLLLLITIFNVNTNASASPAPPADESRTEDDGWTEGDYEGSLEEQEEQAQEDWEDAGRPGEDGENKDDANENEIPDCDFDEFVNDDDECEKIPPNPTTAALPPCDGSVQDCVAENGDICLAGAATHECELPNQAFDGPISAGMPFLEADEGQQKPNPYCDKVPDGYTGSCHDRKDYDEETLLYTCNDGTFKVDWRDCKDATETEKDEDDESPQSTTTELATVEPDPNRFSPTGGGVYFPTESVPILID